jgi:hypothetical protein
MITKCRYFIYLCAAEDKKLFKIDVKTKTISATYSVPEYPIDFAVTSDAAYVASGGKSIYKVVLSSSTVSLFATADKTLYAIDSNTTGTELYLASFFWNQPSFIQKPAQINIIKPTEIQDINNNSNIIKITKNNVKPTKKINHEFRNEHQNIASQPSKTVENSTEILENPAEEYSADYVIVNGKKIYNEEEAIDITKEAFQLFASNVTKTINQAEPIKNLSINF